ncbi:MAG: hypothetical protein HC904_17340, partial [Blastochloris sp.]|nr:hypothetical protein [Blastochloris sp.]
MENPNHTATICGMVFCWLLAGVIINPKRRGAIWFLFAVIVCLVILINTGSRAGLLALLCGFGTMLAIRKEKHLIKPLFFGFIAIMLVLFTAIGPVQRFSGASFTNALQERAGVWAGACILSKLGGWKGLGEGSFGSAFNVVCENQNTNKVWIVALGDPQTLSVEYGWWASGLWITFSGILLTIGLELTESQEPAR